MKLIKFLLPAAMALCGCHTIEITNSTPGTGRNRYVSEWDSTTFYGTNHVGEDKSVETMCQGDNWRSLTIQESAGTTATNFAMHYVPVIGGAIVGGVPGFFIGALLIVPGFYNNFTLVYTPVEVSMICRRD